MGQLTEDDTVTLMTLDYLVPQCLLLGDKGVQGWEGDLTHLCNPPLCSAQGRQESFSWTPSMSQPREGPEHNQGRDRRNNVAGKKEEHRQRPEHVNLSQKGAEDNLASRQLC